MMCCCLLQNKDGCKGSFWFTEHDLKEGVHVKRDKTSASLLQLLRHTGRLKEVRLSGEGVVVAVKENVMSMS